jgi:hypothetical protein
MDTCPEFFTLTMLAETQRNSSHEHWTRIGRLNRDLQNIQVALQGITYYGEYLLEPDNIRCVIDAYWIYGDIFGFYHCRSPAPGHALHIFVD